MKTSDPGYSKFTYRFVYNRKHDNSQLVQCAVYNPANRRMMYLGTSVKIPPECWDKKQQVVVNLPQAEQLNTFLYNFKNNLESLEMGYRLSLEC